VTGVPVAAAWRTLRLPRGALEATALAAFVIA
jgi:hypothetical protein